MTESTAVFTIASKNYLHHVRVLMDSIRKHHPEWRCFLLLADCVDNCFDPAAENFEIIEAKDLAIPEFRRFAFQYSIMEFNTAVKPWAFEHLFEGYDVGRVIYFDPDIRLYRPLRELEEALDAHDIVLTPHLTQHLPDDGKYPSELDILRSGTHNLGFAALRRSEQTTQMLGWWQGRLLKDCRKAVAEGIFVDQKWIDLIPSLYPSYMLLRNPGYNVAYWNLHERPITRDQNGIVMAAGQPLAFFHFSGFDPVKSDVLSKHNTRYMLADVPSETQSLFEEYRQELMLAGYSRGLPYAYGAFSNGVAIHDAFRVCFRSGKFPEAVENSADPFDAQNGCVLEYLMRPVDKGLLIGAAIALLHGHEGMRGRFPLGEGADSHTYAGWFASQSPAEVGMDIRFTEAQREFFRRRPPKLDSGPYGVRIFRLIAYVGFQFVRLIKSLVPIFLKDAIKARFRRRSRPGPGKSNQKINSAGTPVSRSNRLKRLLPVSFKDAAKAELARYVSSATPKDSAFERSGHFSGAPGINILGKFSAASGVGQSARACAMATRASGISHAVSELTWDDMAVGVHGTFLPHRVNLFHFNADQVAARSVSIESILEDRFNIGCWVWELDVFPEQWDNAFNPFNEIWTPSSFCRESISQRSPIPVTVMPYCIQVPARPTGPRKRLGLPEDRFLALCMFDAGSFFERKNPLAAIRAFRQAFAPDNRATLVMKARLGDRAPQEMELLQRELETCDTILLKETLSREEVLDLIEACDTVLSLHRSEGFGLILAEAMAMGKPVIATGYSGNMEFMTKENSFPIDFSMVTLDHDVGPYAAGAHWAEPEIDHAAECLRQVLHDRDMAAHLGQRAKEDIVKLLSPKVIGERYRQRLSELDVDLGPQ